MTIVQYCRMVFFLNITVLNMELEQIYLLLHVLSYSHKSGKQDLMITVNSYTCRKRIRVYIRICYYKYPG